MKKIRQILVFITFTLCAFAASADDLKLLSAEVIPAEQDKVRLVLKFSNPPGEPQSFSLEEPAMIALDFPIAKNMISQDALYELSASGAFSGMDVIEAEDKTRVVVKLVKLVPYDVVQDKNTIYVTLGSLESVENMLERSLEHVGPKYEVKGFDFKRGSNGGGRLVFDLTTHKATVDMEEDVNKVILKFAGAVINDNLLKKYDVLDFATPVQSVDVLRRDSTVDFVLTTQGDCDKVFYQVENQFVLDVKPKTEESSLLNQEFNGNKISLNFQDIEVRAILQIIGEFTGFNMIVNDTVKGNITLRLHNIPWDQALDIVLRTKGLSKRQMGNVMLIGSTTEISEQEKAELESQKQAMELGPLKSELIQVNYATADDLAGLLRDRANSLLTSRGTVAVDKRTNTLLVQDIAQKINEIRALLEKLDIPVRQVEIASQVVTMKKEYERKVGMRLGGGIISTIGHRKLGVGSSIDRSRAIADSASGRVPPSDAVIDNTIAFNDTGPTLANTEGLFTDLGAAAISGVSAGKFAFSLARLPGNTLLDLELQALEYESVTKTISKPRVVTLDQNKATIEQGTDVPYSEASSSGAATVSYKSAVLKLDVTPHITPDNRISLELEISDDSVGTILAAGPQIDKNHILTKVLVDNGETVILGGIQKISDNTAIAKIPVLGDIPIFGRLFRSKSVKSTPSELLIFLTPKIIEVTNKG